jgi:tubulin epsilon
MLPPHLTSIQVINGTLRSRQGSLFDEEEQILKRSSGAGNNFAHGYFGYGDYHCDRLVDMFRRQLEACECAESVLFMHSLGGGTGSGLGTRAIAEVADYAPKLNRVAASILPSTSASEVVTSPYNVLLALKQLSDFATVVLPIDNNKLAQLVQSARSSRYAFPGDNLHNEKENAAREGYASMNKTVALLLSDLTTQACYQGERCTFLFDMQQRLTLPRQHFLTASTTLSEGNKAIRFSQYAPVGTSVSFRLKTYIRYHRVESFVFLMRYILEFGTPSGILRLRAVT